MPLSAQNCEGRSGAKCRTAGLACTGAAPWACRCPAAASWCSETVSVQFDQHQGRGASHRRPSFHQRSAVRLPMPGSFWKVYRVRAPSVTERASPLESVTSSSFLHVSQCRASFISCCLYCKLLVGRAPPPWSLWPAHRSCAMGQDFELHSRAKAACMANSYKGARLPRRWSPAHCACASG